MLINFNYAGVDSVTFTPSGGTLHPGYADHGVHDFNFAMDNLVATIPEPRAGMLVLVAIALIAVAHSGKGFQDSRRSSRRARQM
jgi:hypothetical protein